MHYSENNRYTQEENGSLSRIHLNEKPERSELFGFGLVELPPIERKTRTVCCVLCCVCLVFMRSDFNMSASTAVLVEH